MSDNKLSVIGISRSTGDYNGTQFDNTYFHCIKPADTSKNQSGQLCEIIKVKTASIVTMPELNSFIVPVYNRYGQVQTIEVI